MKTIKWTKPSGMKVETNDKPATVAHCESLGWKKNNGKKPKEKEDDPAGSGGTTGSEGSGAVTGLTGENKK